MTHHKIKSDIQGLLTFDTKTTLVQKTTKDGNISYHLQTDILDTHGNLIPLTTAYANIAKLEALSYAIDVDLKLLKMATSEIEHD